MIYLILKEGTWPQFYVLGWTLEMTNLMPEFDNVNLAVAWASYLDW